MATEILRFGGFSIGQFDERNYYVALITIAGKGAKDAGQERLEKMTYYSSLGAALGKAADRAVREVDAKSLKAWGEAIKKLEETAVAAINEAAKRLEKVAPKLTYGREGKA